MRSVPAYAQRRRAVEDVLAHGPERLDGKPDRHRRERLLEGLQHRDEGARRQHHVDHQGNFRFQPVAEPLDLGPQTVEPARQVARFGQHSPARLAEPRFAGGLAFEQGDAEHRLQIVDRVSDRRGRAVEPAPRSSEGARLRPARNTRSWSMVGVPISVIAQAFLI